MAKSKAKSNGEIKKTGRPPLPQLPKGFKPIEHLGNYWSGKIPGDSFEGKLLSVKLKHFDKKGVYPARDVNVYTFLTKKGQKIEVTQSGGLKVLEDIAKGQTVCIVYRGLKKIKAGQQPMREYVVGVK